MRTYVEMERALEELRYISTTSQEGGIRQRAARALDTCSAVFQEIKLRRDGLIRKTKYENDGTPGEGG